MMQIDTNAGVCFALLVPNIDTRVGGGLTGPCQNNEYRHSWWTQRRLPLAY
jgi:hypothetical protein